ncbi:hypothetical protein [Symbiopectobacterium sp.]|uniref:hypothetical protein n=1 Tax=Symbiopectobacterium sp. TaxID=2952789 RepID=UPI003F6830A3
MQFAQHAQDLRLNGHIQRHGNHDTLAQSSRQLMRILPQAIPSLRDTDPFH